MPEAPTPPDQLPEHLPTLTQGEGYLTYQLPLVETASMEEGQQTEYRFPHHVVTEYTPSPGRETEGFGQLIRFYRAAHEELGDLIPPVFFIERNPSDEQDNPSWYVIQVYEDDEFNRTAKSLRDLNSDEYSVEFSERLLGVQERLMAFLEEHAGEIPGDWLNPTLFDPKGFKEDVLYSPTTGKIQLAGLFQIDAMLSRKVIESEGTFEPSQNRLKLLKMLGLTRLARKISWAIERSAAPEWLGRTHVHWTLDRQKLEQEGKKAMALTFDDGPNAETAELLDILNEKGVKATFFLTGSQILKHVDVVRRIIAEGHDVGVHEWGQEGAPPSAGIREYSRRFLGPRRDLGDVRKTARFLKVFMGKRPEIGRIAGVHGTVDSRREFQLEGLDVIHANPYDVVAIAPSKTLRAGTLLKRALRGNGQGRIRVFHIGTITDKGVPLERSEIDYSKGEVHPAEETVKMISEYIDRSTAQGFEFVKVSDYIRPRE